jgi:hypothetical protein
MRMGSLDPDPDSQSGSRRAKMTHKRVLLLLGRPLWRPRDK